MATPIKPSAAGTPVQHEKVSFGDSSTILREGNMEMFLPLASKEDLLKEKLTGIDTTGEERKALVDLFQSITTGAKFTHEIVEDFNKVLNNSENSKLKDLFTVVYTTSQDHKVPPSKLLLDKKHKIYGLHSDRKDTLINYKMEDLCQGSSEIVNSISNSKDLNLNFVNRGSSPSKLEPHYSAILINNPDVRVGLKNSLEMSTFLNVVNTLEFSRAYPYFNAVFILPDKVNKNQEKPFKTASMNQFLFGGSITGNNASTIAKSFESKVIKRKTKFGKGANNNITTSDDVLTGVEANMSLFTSPQTMINANELKGHFDSIKAIVGEGYDRGATPRDTMLPFMTLKDFSIDASPTRGLMSYKTGKLSIVLHDKNRMIDIAPLIKPDLFGAFGAEIVIEYGWSHPDANTPGVNNKIGEFINSSRCVEKYMIVNSTFTIDNNGMVNIDLAIAAKGPVMFKLVEVLKSPEYTKFASASEKINTKIQNSLKTISTALGEADDKINLISKRKIDENSSVSFLDISDTSDLLDGKKSLIPEDVLGQMKEFITRFDQLKTSKIILADKTLLPSGPAQILLSNFGFKDFYSKTVTSETLVAISELRHNVLELMGLYAKIIADQEIVHETKDLFIKSILGGTVKEDPFYNKNLANDIKISNFRGSEVTEVPRYVSLGSIISSVIGNYFINGVNNSIDEVQLVFYTANENAGYMANRNVSSILVDTEKLKELLAGISSKPNSIVTIESLLAKIISGIVHQKDNVSYGMSSYYSQVKNIEKNEDLDDKQKKREKESLSSKKEDLLKNIYQDSEKDKFVVPQVHFIFDSLTSKSSSNSDATICRITIYDRHDSPFQSINSLIQKHTGVGRLLEFNSKIAKIKRQNRKVKENELRDDIEEFRKKKNKLIKEMESGPTPLIVRDNKTKDYKLSPKTGMNDIKKFIRRYMPYTKIGTQNSGIINASMSTINEGKLLTTYLTRPDRNNELIETRVKTDLPLRVMPSQAQIELFGCPWVQFSQMIFLDFGTETTIDNQYVVTGISHQISPGKFTTSLKLSYGDFYGPVETAINNITDLINSKLEEKLVKRKLEREKKLFDSSQFAIGQPSFSAGAVFSGDTDVKYLSLLKDPESIRDALTLAGFEYDSNSKNNPPVKLLLKGKRSFKGKSFELFSFKYKTGNKKKSKSGQKEAILSLARTILKFRILFPEKQIKITDSFREPDAGGSINSQHKAGLAFDILTTSFYTSGKPTYENNTESDLSGLKAMNTFYELAKGEGYNSFGIGNGVLHIDARETGKGASWVYNYNFSSPKPKKGKGHSSVIGNKKLSFNVDKWKPDDKTSITVNRESWIKEIWTKYNKDMSLGGFGKEGSGYDYLPYTFKIKAGVDASDKDFKIDSQIIVDSGALSNTVETLFASSEQDLKRTIYKNLFVNNFKITLTDSVISKINKKLKEEKPNGEIVDVQKLPDVEKKETIKKYFEGQGITKISDYIDKEFIIKNNCSTKESEDEFKDNEILIKSHKDNSGKIIKIDKSLKTELVYTTIGGNLVNEFILPEANLPPSQWFFIKENNLDIDLTMTIDTIYRHEGYAGLLTTNKFLLNLNAEYEIYPQVTNTKTNDTRYDLLIDTSTLKSKSDIPTPKEEDLVVLNYNKDDAQIASITAKNAGDIIEMVSVKEIEVKILDKKYNITRMPIVSSDLTEESNRYVIPVWQIISDSIKDYYIKDILKIEKI